MPESLQRLYIDNILHKFSNKMLLENVAPEKLSTQTIIPVPKKGNLRLTNNYREIALTSPVPKS